MPSPPTAPGTVTLPTLVSAPAGLTANSSTMPAAPVSTDRNWPSGEAAESTVPASVLTGLPTAVSDPAGPSANIDSLALPAFPAKSSRPAAATQHVAAWPVAAVAIGVTVPDGFSAKLVSAFVPASAMTRLPARSKAIPNGTVPGSELTTGALLRPPLRVTANTSMSLPFDLVVTINWLPSGENATWPGVFTNCGVAAGSRPSVRFDPRIGTRRPKAIRYPCTAPPFSALSTYT